MRKLKIVKRIIIIVLIIFCILYIGFRTNHSIKGMQLYETEHFELFYEELSKNTLIDLENQLEWVYDKTKKFFNNEERKEAKYRVIIYTDVDTFQKSCFGLFLTWVLPDYYVGAASGELVLMTSPENPDDSHGYEDMIEIAAHEWIHTKIFEIEEMADIWLDEGAATYFSEQKQPFIGEIPSYEVMSKQNLNSFVEAEGYCYSFYYFEFLIKNFTTEEIHELIRTNDYKNALGITKEDLYLQWIDYIRKEMQIQNSLDIME